MYVCVRVDFPVFSLPEMVNKVEYKKLCQQTHRTRSGCHMDTEELPFISKMIDCV